MQNEPIIETSLREQAEALHRIVFEEGNRAEIERQVTNWANGLLMSAAKDEPGLIRLLPPLADEPEYIKKTPHQSIGSGPYSRNF